MLPDIEYTLTEKEFLDYNYYVGWQSPRKKQIRLKYLIVFPLLFALIIGIFFYYTDGESMTTSSWIMLVVAPVVFLLLIRFRMRSVFDKQARKMLTESGPDVVLSKTRLTINENGIVGKTPVAEVKYSWTAFQGKRIANDCYYLFINARQALVIPARAFTSQSEKEMFDKMLLQYFPLQAELNSLNSSKQ